MVLRFPSLAEAPKVLLLWCAVFMACVWLAAAVPPADAQPVFTSTGDSPLAAQEMAERYAQEEGDSASDAPSPHGDPRTRPRTH